MGSDRLESFLQKDHARITGFHGSSYTKKILRHLLWITIGVILFILLTVIVLQFLYDSIRMSTLSLMLGILLIVVSIVYRRIRKAKRDR